MLNSIIFTPHKLVSVMTNSPISRYPAMTRGRGLWQAARMLVLARVLPKPFLGGMGFNGVYLLLWPRVHFAGCIVSFPSPHPIAFI